MELIKNAFPQFSQDQLSQFGALPALYEEWNAKINVISRKDMEQFATRHILHSLAIIHLKDIQPGQRVLDVGTGGGFPGIPLAIAYPDTHFTLVDSIGKKIKVVQAVTDAIGLPNVSALHTRTEQLKDRSFDRIIARAVAPALKIVRYTDQLIAGGGRYLFLKGGDLFEEESDLKRFYPQMSWEEYKLEKWFSDPFFKTKLLVRSRWVI